MNSQAPRMRVFVDRREVNDGALYRNRGFRREEDRLSEFVRPPLTAKEYRGRDVYPALGCSMGRAFVSL